MSNTMMNVDVAHPPRSQETVETELSSILRLARAQPSIRALKIIHGYGSSGKGGSTKKVVLNWIYRNRKRIGEVIPGEEYSRLDVRVQDLWTDAELPDDPDLGKTNPGITILRIR